MLKPVRTLLFFLIIIAPFAVLAWLGLKTGRDDFALQQVRFKELLSSKLDVIAAEIARVPAEKEQSLVAVTRIANPSPDALRTLVQETPSMRGVFLLDRNGKLVFPQNDETASAEEKDFLPRITHMLNGGERFVRNADNPRDAISHGWHVWYAEEGATLLFWQRLADGEIVGVELSRSALLADIVGSITEDLPAGIDPSTVRVLLVDESGRTVYGFGRYEPESGTTPLAERALDPPLGSMKLRFFIAKNTGPDGAASFNIALFAGIGALFIVIVLGTVYYLRETGRDLREAERRVTFVNQVSHELKTPLTNIRMYAELLEMDLEDAEPATRDHLLVIVQESGRLSRLIANVLTFGRGMRNALSLHPSPEVVDEIIRKTASQFTLGFKTKDIEIHLDLNAPAVVMLDADAATQILGNLLSNVEKYAAGGKRVEITTRQHLDQTVITVSDNGPGIPNAARARIFDPFFRVSGALTDGVTGTGIGLAIARDLARLHGGDLTLEPSEVGACFQVVLRTPLHFDDVA